jgi:hypothetical protein
MMEREEEAKLREQALKGKAQASLLLQEFGVKRLNVWSALINSLKSNRSPWADGE